MCNENFVSMTWIPKWCPSMIKTCIFRGSQLVLFAVTQRSRGMERTVEITNKKFSLDADDTYYVINYTSVLMSRDMLFTVFTFAVIYLKLIFLLPCNCMYFNDNVGFGTSMQICSTNIFTPLYFPMLSTLHIKNMSQNINNLKQL